MIERQAVIVNGPNTITIKVRHRPDFTFACPVLMNWFTADPAWQDCVMPDPRATVTEGADRAACDEVQETEEIRCTHDGEVVRRRIEVRRYLTGDCRSAARVAGTADWSEWISRRIPYNFTCPDQNRDRVQDVEFCLPLPE
jgi:hypothetical protein